LSTFHNPIIPGFYPDPSVVRVDEDYYLVTSSFEFFPGVPIFHSRDLVNWRQIGHVLDRPSQLNLDGIEPSRGIWAPTIRYHQGIFYMITTFVDNDKKQHNFYVTTKNPAGDWSDPVFLDDAPGIDPSLLFDNDGKVYYTGNRIPPEGQTHAKNMDIWLQELDVDKGQLVGPKYSIWQGALKVAHAQEAPHLYRIGDWYYIMIAEGGTGVTHAVTIARSKNVIGPYEGYKGNPILTHRHLGRDYPIVNVGHGDLVETQHGEWWMVCLASRPYGGYYRNLGRETFLTPVKWEKEWPVVNPGKGVVEAEGQAPSLPACPWPNDPIRDDFDGEQLGDVWNTLRTPREAFYSLTDRPGYLRLRLRPATLEEVAQPSFIGRRLQHFSFRASTQLAFKPQQTGEVAGIVLLQNQNYHYRFEYGQYGDATEIRLLKRKNGVTRILASQAYIGGQVQLQVQADEQDYRFSFRADDTSEWVTLMEQADGRILSTDVAGGFTGAYMGMYVSSQGMTSDNYADFAWFEYEAQAKSGRPERPSIPSHEYSIIDYGASGDGITCNTKAIQAALDECADAGGGKVVIPAGVWRTGPLSLRSRLNLHLEQGALLLFEPDPAQYPLISSFFEGSKAIRCQSPLDGEGLHDVAITGEGIIDGGGQGWRPVKKFKMTDMAWKKLIQSGGVVDEKSNIWWPSEGAMNGEGLCRRLREQGITDPDAYLPIRDYLRPTLLSLRSSERVLLSGPTFQNSPAWNLHLFNCEQITVEHVTVRNPWYSQNGDGIDLESCRHAWVEHSSFDVGDDAICLKSGKDEEGRQRGLPTEYVTIKNCTVYHGHGGVVIGSEMSGGVRAVRVSDCTFIGTDIGLRFKSARGRGGVVEDIEIERIRMNGIVHEAVSFHMFYEGKEGSEGYNDKTYPVTEETPIFRNIILRDIVCHGASTALLLNGLPEMPISELTIDGLYAVANRGVIGRYVDLMALADIRLDIEADEQIELVQCSNVTLDGAAYRS